MLKRPSALLMGEKPNSVMFRLIFPLYHKPLPLATQHRIRQQASARGCYDEGETLFLHAYAVTTRDQRIQERLDSFRNQYGFARNMCFAFLLSALGILAAYWSGLYPIRLRWALVAASVGVVLFYRYLKFFRQFSYELLLRYAELSSSDAKSASVGA